MRVLKAVPDSILWLTPLAPVVEQNLRREASARGVAPERIILARRVPGKAEHLGRHRLADLFLDAFIYNGHTTASDALWAGLPVLTCPGETFPSRVGASLLKAVGLPELIAPDRTRYEELAIELARKPEKLRALRTKLEAQRTTWPLFDTARLVRNLERAYRAMWDRFAAGEAPQPIIITER
jgi:predicted O-linked N-acetylglucosamine transferase (SPINDLY family)